jgi:ferredoxin-NADP reductase
MFTEMLVSAGGVVSGARRLWTSPWLRPLNDLDAVDDLLGLANPLWSVREVRAEVVRVLAETPDARTFVLRPNGRWGGFLAGQHVSVRVEIDGVRHERSYSISSAPGEPTLALTVKRRPGGRVSGFLHDAVRPGRVLGLSRASGRFVLADPPPVRLLLLSAGSGITPLMSMLRDLHARRCRTDVVLVHSCRTPADGIFRAELLARARDWPALRLAFVFTADGGRLNRERLARLVPDWREREALLCGPASFMDLVGAMWREAGVDARLRSESFTGPASARPAAGAATVSCVRSGVAFRAVGDRPLLVEAERAGLRPSHGCRVGVCRTCLCRKVSGTVEDLTTGAVSSAPDAMIPLCVSAARSDLVLAL